MRKRTKARWLVALGAVMVAGCCSICSTAKYEDSVDEGFVSLFNGKDLTGWYGSKMYGVAQHEIKFEGGATKEVPVLACFPDRKIAGDRGNLLTEKEYRNFILRFEFMMPENGNNGLGIRTPSPDVDAAYDGMCELQLLDDGGSKYYDKNAKRDKLKPYQYTGSIYGIVPSRRDNTGKQIWGKDKNFTGGGSYVRKPGMWNFEEVKVIGSEIEVYLNGYLVTKGDVAHFRGDGDTPDGKRHPGLHNGKGHIGWLGHGHRVLWKNIRIKELPDDAKMGEVCPCQKAKCPAGFTAYFDGCPKQLKTMWKGVTTEEKFDNPVVRRNATAEKRAEMQAKADKGRDEHWSVRNGNLFFDGYKGGYSLATAKDLGDFEMWADWRIMSVTGDSGLYLRGAPQVQIWDAHNQWNIGSGGLYNNKKNPSQALKIADRQVGDWNRFHIVMRGEKVTVWLNGELVVDNVTLENYWDRKRPLPAVEQLELQCHGDPTEWRNIFIRELPSEHCVAPERIGVCSWSWKLPMRQVVEKMEQNGIRGVNLALVPFISNDKYHGGSENAETWAWLKEKAVRGDIVIMSTMISTVGEDYTTIESIRKTGGIVPDAHWAENQKIVERGAQLTAELKCPYLLTHAGFLDHSDPKAYATYLERVTWMRDTCAKYGVTLILETGQETAADLAEFLPKVPGVYVNFDPANMILYSKGNPTEALRTLMPWIKQIHVKDAVETKVPGTWGKEVAWGDGQVGGKAFVAELDRLGYTGNFVIEREAGDDRPGDIAQAVRRLEK